MPHAQYTRWGAELLGTFAFVLVGAGSAVAASAAGVSDPASALLIAALANGLGLAVAVSATMGLSGGSLNPAITLALYAARKLPLRDVFPYVVAELVGATLAVSALTQMLPSNFGSQVNWGSPVLSSTLSIGQGVALELVMTVVLALAVFGTAVSPNAPKLGGFGIGAAVIADVLLGGTFTGAAMNPARAMGPMVAGNFLPGYWYIYWVGPVVGALVVGLFYRVYAERSDR